MSNSKSRSSAPKTLVMAQLGVLSALIIVMTFVPYVGYISYGVLSITLIHIPVIVGAIVMGPKYGSILGGVWGVSCIIKALLAPPTPLEGIIFRNPLISLIPRVLVGLVAGLLYNALSKRDRHGYLATGIAAGFASLVNTLLVLGGMYLFYSDKIGFSNTINFGDLTKWIMAAFTLNAPIEIAVCVILSIPICKALKKMKTKIS